MKIRKGMTLIEVILSIAIISIIVVPIFTIFNTGLFNIFRAGVRTETVIDVKKGIDDVLRGNAVDESKVITSNISITDDVNVKFGDTGKTLTIPGNSIKKYFVENKVSANHNIIINIYSYDIYN